MQAHSPRSGGAALAHARRQRLQRSQHHCWVGGCQQQGQVLRMDRGGWEGLDG